MAEQEGRLTYCYHCKAMTKTILEEIRPLILWKETKRTCFKCGEPKTRTRIEQ